MGVSRRIPTEFSRVFVPRLPLRLQRFQPAQTWLQAESASVGYANLAAPELSSRGESVSPLFGNDVSALASFGVALNALRGTSGPVRVVDFGGYDGKHHAMMASHFATVDFSWTVVELPQVVNKFDNHRAPGLSFTSELNDALCGGADIVLASASLNYVPDPLVRLTTMLSSSQVVVLSRLPLWPIPEHHVAIQRAQRKPEISYPTWFFSEVQFLSELGKSTEVLLDVEFPDDRASFKSHYSTYRGLVLARKAASSEPQR